MTNVIPFPARAEPAVQILPDAESCMSVLVSTWIVAETCVDSNQRLRAQLAASVAVGHLLHDHGWDRDAIERGVRARLARMGGVR